jgi:putative hydrolase of the HAD superfamily
MAYAAALFDLFDTLVRFDRERMPLIQVNGKSVRSTAGRLHAILQAYDPGLTLERCYGALIESWQAAERQRAVDYREVSAPERFTHFFTLLGVDGTAYPPGLVTTLIEAHRHELAKAAEFPAHHRELLERLAPRYRLALVSNFDYTPTAVGILEMAGVAHLFTAMVVSDGIGWRKPRREIFDAALRQVGAAPAEALFVGDRAELDVLGAHGVGMDAAWLNPAREPLPAGVTAPRYEIRDLRELGAILGV